MWTYQVDDPTYFECKVAEGKTKKDGVRTLERQISNAVYRHLAADAHRAAR